MPRTRYWWPTATTEQKLHQVKHAIEARLTSGEAAILLGAKGADQMRNFAAYNGLSFANSDRVLANKRTRIGNKNCEAARVAGWRAMGIENVYIFDNLENRRPNDDDIQELRFTE